MNREAFTFRSGDTPQFPAQVSVPAPPGSSQSSGSRIAVGSTDEANLISRLENGAASLREDDTRSLTDSIRQHIVEGGLRYHAYHAGSYAFPNDENEQERDDLKHDLCVYLCDGNYFFAPVGEALQKEGAQVLDLGTGTGKWVVELADNYPKAEFTGMDLSPIQPDWVPENVSFIVDDIEHEAGWTHPESFFDLIHLRQVIFSIRNRKEAWDRMYHHLKPGGWVEVQEFEYVIACDDDSCSRPYALRDFCLYLDTGLAALGHSLHSIRETKRELEESGFTEIQSQSFKCPIGPWAKKRRLQECGHVLRDTTLTGLNGLARRPFREGLGWSLVQIEMFLVEVRKSILEEENGLPTHHSYLPFHCYYARKPLDAT